MKKMAVNFFIFYLKFLSFPKFIKIRHFFWKNDPSAILRSGISALYISNDERPIILELGI